MSTLKRIALDIETDSIEATKLWCIVVKELDTGELRSYVNNWEDFKRDVKDVELIVGHNILQFDLYHLNRLIGWDYQGKVHDTLILSQLLKYELEGGHSLEAWGVRLKHPKTEHKDFSKFSPELLNYCKDDVTLSTKVYHWLMAKLKPEVFNKAIEVEHEVAKILRKTKDGGFPFDIEKMYALRKEIEARVEELDRLILDQFPPKFYSLGEYIPRLTKHGTISRSNLRWYAGTDYSVFSPDCPLTRLGVEPFNPGSPKQIVTRLTDNDWWDPIERTNGYTEASRARSNRSASADERRVAEDKLGRLDKYGWKVNENNLSTLKDTAPESARLLVERLALGNRLSTFDQWERAYNTSTKSIHGTIHGIGTWTHRCSHTHPNLANIAAKKSIKYKEVNLAKKITELGGRMRDLFHAGADGNWLVGTDAEGIQLRLFSHYANDDALIKANVEGNKELGTDIHSLNRRALGDVCKTRDDAKTWIYAYLLGAGQAKLASILGCSHAQSKLALDNLLSTYRSIDRLRKETIVNDARRGYFRGLDGRLVVCNSEHLMLAGYLQNGEKCIMAHALVEAERRIKKEQIQARLANWVHDEFQFIVHGTKEDANRIGVITSDCIKWAGENLECKCPMSGNFAVGKTWLDTH